MRFPRYKYVLLVLDLLAVSASFIASMWLRFHYIVALDAFPAVILPFFAALFLQYNGLYKLNIFLNRSASTFILFKSLLPISIIYVLGGFLTRFMWIATSRLAFVYFIVILAVVFAVYRVGFLPVVFGRLSEAGIQRRRVLIVGAGKCGKQLASSITSRTELGLELVGFVDDRLPIGTPVLKGLHVLGDSAALEPIVETHFCDEVAIAIDNISHSELFSLISAAKDTGTTVKVVSNLFRSISDVTVTESYTLQPTATLTRGLDADITAIYQRVTDLFLSFVGLVILLPFFTVAAILIKLTSTGPVFYLHERIGKGGKIFKMYKFRSMYTSADGDQRRKKMMLDFINGNDGKNASGKVIDYSRVTWIGKLMRNTSFDELPQLINVLKGEMSLVGPRPALPYEYDAMKTWHRERNRVLPGCTGFWQVYGRGLSSFDDMVIMDIYMIENVSPWLYLELILRTFPALFLGKGGK